MNRESYMVGFSKVASVTGYSIPQLLQISRNMQKQAKVGSLAKLLTRMSPKVDPNKLNWFTRLFTTTKNKLHKVRTHVPSGPGAEGARAYSSGETYNEGLSDLMTSETRLSPLKILAGLTGLGAGGATVASMLPEKKKSLIDRWNELDPVLRKKILIGLGATGGALALYGIGSAMNSK